MFRLRLARPARPALIVAARLGLATSLLLSASAAWSRPSSGIAPRLTPEVGLNLPQAAGDASLLPWQRQLTRALAGQGEGRDGLPPLSKAAPPVPATRAGEEMGVWSILSHHAMAGTAAVYDPRRNRMLVFAPEGFTTNHPSDVWELPLSGDPVWSRLGTRGPPARDLATMIYDPVRDRVVVFGGFQVTCGDISGCRCRSSDETWALSLQDPPTWSLLATQGAPPPARDGHAAIYDPIRDRMIVIAGTKRGGGQSGCGAILQVHADAWALSLAGTPTWTQLAFVGTGPSGAPLSAVYDPLRDRLLALSGNSVQELRLSGTPTWSPIPSSGTPPAGTTTAAYDESRDRLLAFNGTDVWALPLAGPTIWSKLLPAGTAPGMPRSFLICDPLADRLVVFGGEPGADPLRDGRHTWQLELAGVPRWSLYGAEHVPPAVAGHSAVYDPVRHRMVSFGGKVWRAGITSETWMLPLSGSPVWNRLGTSGTAPLGIEGHSAVYEPARDRMLVFGVSTQSAPSNEVWSLSFTTASWQRIQPLNPLDGPPPLSGQGAIYDPVRDRMVVFGGFSDFGGIAFTNGVWALALADGPSWIPLAGGGGTGPKARAFHSAIHDPMRNRMVIFGGYGFDAAYEEFFDVWSFSLDSLTWTEITPAGSEIFGPSSGAGHTSIYDPVRDRMVVFGGQPGWGSHVGTWALAFSPAIEWRISDEVEQYQEQIPPPRSFHSAVYDPVHDRMMVFGGAFPGRWPFGDTWALTWGHPLVHVAIDIKPGSSENTIHLGSGGVVPVAVLSSASFDAATVNPATVTLAGAPVRRDGGGRPMASRIEVDRDGRLDLLVHIEVEALGLSPGDTTASLEGETTDGRLVRGADRVHFVPRRDRSIGPLGVQPGPRSLAVWLGPAAPNPARESVRIPFGLPRDARVSLAIYDVSGRRLHTVLDETIRSGNHVAEWDGRDGAGGRAASGVYVYRMAVEGRTFSGRLAFLR